MRSFDNSKIVNKDLALVVFREIKNSLAELKADIRPYPGLSEDHAAIDRVVEILDNRMTSLQIEVTH